MSAMFVTTLGELKIHRKEQICESRKWKKIVGIVEGSWDSRK